MMHCLVNTILDKARCLCVYPAFSDEETDELPPYDMPKKNIMKALWWMSQNRKNIQRVKPHECEADLLSSIKIEDIQMIK